jgi:hypothetical protein
VAIFVLGRFGAVPAFLAAGRKMRELGYSDLDGHAPYPVDGADEALGFSKSPVPKFVLAGGLFGASFAYLMQYWCNGINYPLNVGGRPLNSYPAFIPIVFELGVLFASFSAFFALLGFARLARPYHPVFESSEFRSATVDKFWISVRVAPDSDRAPLLRAFEEVNAEIVDTVDDEDPRFA